MREDSSVAGKVSGQGTKTIIVDGVEKLHGAKYKIPSDRIQAFTYSMVSAATGFDVGITGSCMDDFNGTFDVLKQAGIEVFDDNGVIKTRMISICLFF